MGRFQRADRLVARNRGEVIQEFVQAISAFQVINQVAQRDARTDKDGSSAEDFRIAVNDQSVAGNGAFHLLFILTRREQGIHRIGTEPHSPT